ncbi:MAG TPA: GNAT family N-acetyltransferase [Puia sp.]|jgi:hypothetical protein|nr:GNAT family N-acetyltransferase [Puia sp.]
MSSLDCCPLFFKPVKVNYENEILYERFISAINATVVFRSLQLSTDIELIHDWVNQPYTKRFWQMSVDIKSLQKTYGSILENCHAHSFIGLLNEKITCLIDVYQVNIDELKQHVLASNDDCGLHMLMGPPRQMLKNSSHHMLSEFLSFYFSFPMAGSMYAEPDQENILANRLAKSVGFQFVKTIQLSYKTANLYSITKNQFYAKNKIS